jgi:hypothetical protein
MIVRARYGLTVAALALALAACSSPAKREAMTPQDLLAGKSHPYSLHVQAGGGSETGAMDTSNIADDDLKAAIEDAVIQSKLFKKIVQGKDGDYELSVQVSNLTKPLIGFSFTVEMEAAWSLVKLSDRSVVMRKSVKSSGTASVGDALAAVTRLRMAVEAAARENIRQGLTAVAGLAL